jgi:hypothetical protein
MTRESLEAKAARLLAAGALTVHEVRAGLVRAVCQGDSGRLHRVGYWRGQFGCSCRSSQLRGTCSHLLALRKVVADPRPEDAGARPGLTAQRLRLEQDEASRVRAGKRSA